MTSELILNRADPGVDKLVSGWVDGGEYELTVTVKQVSSDPKSTKLEVVSVASEEAETPAEPAMAKKPSVVVGYTP